MIRADTRTPKRVEPVVESLARALPVRLSGPGSRIPLLGVARAPPIIGIEPTSHYAFLSTLAPWRLIPRPVRLTFRQRKETTCAGFTEGGKYIS